MATNTIEGRVLQRLLEKLQEIRNTLDDDAVFNAIGELLPAAHVERILRDYYSGKLGDADLEDRLLLEETREERLAAATGTILLTPNERRVAEDRRDCFWLHVVTNCATKPTMQEPIKDPARFPWQEVTKVAHYWLEVNAMTRPMMVREDEVPYGGKRP